MTLDDLNKSPVRVIKHNGGTFIDVNEFVDVIVRDLLKAPADMVVTRDEVIYALQTYATDATNAMEEV